MACGGETVSSACRSVATADPAAAQVKLNFICEHFEEATENDAFARYLDHGSLLLLLRNDRLHAEELQVFSGVLAWARAQLAQRNEPPSPANIRRIAGDLLQHVRFPTMSLTDLSTVVKDSEVLTTDELVECFVYKGAKEGASGAEPAVLPRFPTRPRIGLYLRMQRLRAEFDVRARKSIKYQRWFHFMQTPIFICCTPAFLLMFAIMITLYQDENTTPGPDASWWAPYFPLWLLVLLVVTNVASMYYFWHRDKNRLVEDHRGLLIFHGPYDDDNGPIKNVIRGFETSGRSPAQIKAKHALFLCVITQLVLIVIALSVLAAYGSAMSLWWVFLPVFFLLCGMICMPCACGVRMDNGDAVPMMIGMCCIFVPLFVFFALLLTRLSNPPTFLPLWGVFIPLFLWLSLGCCTCIAVFCIGINERYNKKDPILGSCAACLCLLTPFIISTVFFVLRSEAANATGPVSFWVPSLLSCVAPLFVPLAGLLMGGTALALHTSKEMPHPTKRAVPDELLVYSEPPV